MRTLLGAVALLLLPALAGCHRQDSQQQKLASLDAELEAGTQGSNVRDPALTAALHDQIMVDPALVQRANADTVRPPAQPATGALPPDDIAARTKPAETDQLRSAPAASGNCAQCAAAKQALTLGALAQSQGRSAQCAANVNYSAGWANKLPAGVPLYPGARVSEAAGADGAGCALRVVSFASAAPLQRLLDWYYTKTSAAGYNAQHGMDGSQHVLAGTRAGAAFMVSLTPRAGGGTSVDLMADGG